MEESGLSESEWYLQTFRTKVDEEPDPLETHWAGPLVLRMVPPRDWPPRGWHVDPSELAFIREAHRLQSQRVNVDTEVNSKTDDMALERYRVFVKQYKEWVAANRDRVEEESYKYDQDYYPGRRKRGKDYKDDMLELPFFYPGQICLGKVVTLHLHQGAFVDIGGVHDGWVPIKGNDWFWIRHHIKVGMHAVVEVLAKRDPYRFRFPIELRFVNPNIDHLIFNRFEFPPIFHREEDKNPEELWRSAGRPPIPRKRLREKMERQSLMSDHPYVGRLWELHNAEQLILDDEEKNPDKYKNKEHIEAMMNADFDEENSVEVTETYYEEALLPKIIVKINPRDLNLDAARAERQLIKKLKKEAKERGETFKAPKPRRNIEMDEYDFLHWRRSVEEREALIRDISCRTALGLPIKEPGRYVEHPVFKKEYDPTRPMYRYDYWGLPKNSEENKLKRLVSVHNESIVGHQKLWYRMSYDEAIGQKMRLEAQAGPAADDAKKEPNSFIDEIEQGDDDEDEEHEDYIYGLLEEIYDEMESEDGEEFEDEMESEDDAESMDEKEPEDDAESKDDTSED